MHGLFVIPFIARIKRSNCFWTIPKESSSSFKLAGQALRKSRGMRASALVEQSLNEPPVHLPGFLFETHF